MVGQGKYRLRTWLRGALPMPFHRLVPKGRRDCRDHEWYRSSDSTDRCYHCTVGEQAHSAALAGEHRGTEELIAREVERNPELAAKLPHAARQGTTSRS